MKRIKEIIQHDKTIMQRISNMVREKLEDAELPLPEEGPLCPSCYDSGQAPIYRNGKVYFEKCPGWQKIVVDDGKGHRYLVQSFCLVDPEWELRRKANIEDLVNTIKECAAQLGLTYREVELYAQKEFPYVSVKQFDYNYYELLLIHLAQGKIVKHTEPQDTQTSDTVDVCGAA